VVTDLEKSVAFYQRVFGASVEMQFRSEGQDAAILQGVPAAAFSVVMLRIGAPCVELLKFDVPEDAGRTEVRPCDIGAFHVAIEVADAHKLFEELSAANVPFTREPLESPDGQGGTFVLAFCTDPDGNRIELVQTP
jgi:catechol 2,3-dioxygenase-like lactoylglutathione lyase family enzyme